jgi:tryptophan synthase beta subunit
VLQSDAQWTDRDVVLLNLSGRGDKDVAHVAAIGEDRG